MYQSQTVIGLTMASKNTALTDCVWPQDALHYIPDWVYTSRAVYDQEIEKIFHGKTWNYVALEAELPNRATTSGPMSDRPRWWSRAPRTARSMSSRTAAPTVARSSAATARATPRIRLPLPPVVLRPEGQSARHPVQARREPRGRHAQDFKNEEHGLRKLRVATRNGVIFASYSDEVEALEEYLTPDILADFDTVFPGKKLKIHGYYRNELPCNWKMYHENLKDPYHATLLHSFLVVFGLLVAGNKSAMLVDTVHGRHGTMASAKSEEKYASVSEETRRKCARSMMACICRTTASSNSSRSSIRPGPSPCRPSGPT